MTLTRSGTRELSRDECLALLPTVPVGRVLFTERALPALVPVNFVVHAGAVVMRTSPDGTLAAIAQGTVLAFEVDDFHDFRSFSGDHRNGWTVTVLGRLRAVSDAQELAVLHELPLMPYAEGPRDHYLVLPIEMISGRRVGLGPL